MIQLLLCDYQRTARCYTIYRTFKLWSSDDFTTIPRLFAGRNYDYLLRLFQPERYDYCSPLLAIGRKPEKRRGGSRQWFRAARRALLLDCPAGWRVPGWHGLRCAALSGMDPQQGVPLHPYIYLIIIGGCSVLCCVRCVGVIWYRWRCCA